MATQTDDSPHRHSATTTSDRVADSAEIVEIAAWRRRTSALAWACGVRLADPEDRDGH